MSGTAYGVDPVRRRTRAMRPWEWSFPSRPISHREVISALPETDTGRPPLLMVHGIAHAAWCYGENWVPAAADALVSVSEAPVAMVEPVLPATLAVSITVTATSSVKLEEGTCGLDVVTVSRPLLVPAAWVSRVNVRSSPAAVACRLPLPLPERSPELVKL